MHSSTFFASSMHGREKNKKSRNSKKVGIELKYLKTLNIVSTIVKCIIKNIWNSGYFLRNSNHGDKTWKVMRSAKEQFVNVIDMFS